MAADGDLFASVIPTVEVEIFECERYQPLPVQRWSSEALLPTERGKYRARGCNIRWSSLAEVDAALLPLGWAWDRHAWRMEPLPVADVEGWTYGHKWSPSFDGAAEPGQFSLVRWRRLVRLQTFAGAGPFLRAVGAERDLQGCQQVDLDTAARVGRQLLEALAAASLRGEWSMPALVKLKGELVAKLREQRPAQVRSVESVLEEFVESREGVLARARRRLSAAEMLPARLEAGKAAQEAVQEEATARSVELEARFPVVERMVCAAFAMRRLCPELTCRAPDGENPDHDCRFRQVLCRNSGCCERFSRRASDAHDAVCPFKRLACQACSEEVIRREMPNHVASACPERPVPCTFSALGCRAQTAHRALNGHLDDCTQAHLLLLMCELQEQREMIKGLVQEMSVEREVQARARDADRKALGELALSVGSLRHRAERQPDVQAELGALQTKLRQLEASMRQR